jgi:hypothetical protein
MASLVHPERY